MNRRSIWVVLVLAAMFASGCYQTYDPYTGFNKYWPDFNADYINDLSPAVDPVSPAGSTPANAAPAAP